MFFSAVSVYTSSYRKNPLPAILRAHTRPLSSSNVRIDSRFYRYLRIRDLIALSLTILFSMGYDLVGVSLKERCGARLFRSFPCSGAEHDRTAVR